MKPQLLSREEAWITLQKYYKQKNNVLQFLAEFKVPKTKFEPTFGYFHLKNKDRNVLYPKLPEGYNKLKHRNITIKQDINSELENGKVYLLTLVLAEDDNRRQNPYQLKIKDIHNIEQNADTLPAKSFIENLFVETGENPKDAGAIAGQLKLNELELYTHTKRFIFELIQNADDMPTGKKSVEIEMHLLDNFFLFLHNGEYFKRENVRAICNAAHSTKKADVTKTGYKGIGFKSVFSDSKRVFIKSGDYSFKFDKTAKIYKDFWALYKGYLDGLIEEKRRQKERSFKLRLEEYTNIDNIPWQIKPMWVDKNSYPSELESSSFKYGRRNVNIALDIGAETIRSKSYNEMVLSLIKDPRFLLFLRHTASIMFYGEEKEPLKIAIERKKNQRRIFSNNEIIADYAVSDQEVDISNEQFLLAELGFQKTEKDNSEFSFVDSDNNPIKGIPEKLGRLKQTVLTFAAKLDNKGRLVSLPKDESILYNYLPTSDKRFKFPFLVNADFISQTNREGILIENKWNHYLFFFIGYNCIQWLSELTKIRTVRGEYLTKSYLSLLPNLLSETESDLNAINSAFNRGLIKGLEEIAFILDYQIELQRIADIIVDKTFISKVFGVQFFEKISGTPYKLLHKDIPNKQLLSLEYLENKLNCYTNELLINFLNQSTGLEQFNKQISYLDSERYTLLLKALDKFLSSEESEKALFMENIKFIKLKSGKLVSVDDVKNDSSIFIWNTKLKEVKSILHQLFDIQDVDYSDYTNLSDWLKKHLLLFSKGRQIVERLEIQTTKNTSLAPEDKRSLFDAVYSNYKNAGKDFKIFSNQLGEILPLSEILSSDDKNDCVPEWFNFSRILSSELVEGLDLLFMSSNDIYTKIIRSRWSQVIDNFVWSEETIGEFYKDIKFRYDSLAGEDRISLSTETNIIAIKKSKEQIEFVRKDDPSLFYYKRLKRLKQEEYIGLSGAFVKEVDYFTPVYDSFEYLDGSPFDIQEIGESELNTTLEKCTLESALEQFSPEIHVFLYRVFKDKLEGKELFKNRKGTYCSLNSLIAIDATDFDESSLWLKPYILDEGYMDYYKELAKGQILIEDVYKNVIMSDWIAITSDVCQAYTIDTISSFYEDINRFYAKKNDQLSVLSVESALVAIQNSEGEIEFMSPNDSGQLFYVPSLSVIKNDSCYARFKELVCSIMDHEFVLPIRSTLECLQKSEGAFSITKDVKSSQGHRLVKELEQGQKSNLLTVDDVNLLFKIFKYELKNAPIFYSVREPKSYKALSSLVPNKTVDSFVWLSDYCLHSDFDSFQDIQKGLVKHQDIYTEIIVKNWEKNSLYETIHHYILENVITIVEVVDSINNFFKEDPNSKPLFQKDCEHLIYTETGFKKDRDVFISEHIGLIEDISFIEDIAGKTVLTEELVQLYDSEWSKSPEAFWLNRTVNDNLDLKHIAQETKFNMSSSTDAEKFMDFSSKISCKIFTYGYINNNYEFVIDSAKKQFFEENEELNNYLDNHYSEVFIPLPSTLSNDKTAIGLLKNTTLYPELLKQLEPDTSAYQELATLVLSINKLEVIRDKYLDKLSGLYLKSEEANSLKGRFEENYLMLCSRVNDEELIKIIRNKIFIDDYCLFDIKVKEEVELELFGIKLESNEITGQTNQSGLVRTIRDAFDNSAINRKIFIDEKEDREDIRESISPDLGVLKVEQLLFLWTYYRDSLENYVKPSSIDIVDFLSQYNNALVPKEFLDQYINVLNSDIHYVYPHKYASDAEKLSEDIESLFKDKIEEYTYGLEFITKQLMVETSLSDNSTLPLRKFLLGEQDDLDSDMLSDHAIRSLPNKSLNNILDWISTQEKSWSITEDIQILNTLKYIIKYSGQNIGLYVDQFTESGDCIIALTHFVDDSKLYLGFEEIEYSIKEKVFSIIKAHDNSFLVLKDGYSKNDRVFYSELKDCFESKVNETKLREGSKPWNPEVHNYWSTLYNDICFFEYDDFIPYQDLFLGKVIRSESTSRINEVQVKVDYHLFLSKKSTTDSSEKFLEEKLTVEQRTDLDTCKYLYDVEVFLKGGTNELIFRDEIKSSKLILKLLKELVSYSFKDSDKVELLDQLYNNLKNSDDVPILQISNIDSVIEYKIVLENTDNKYYSERDTLLDYIKQIHNNENLCNVSIVRDNEYFNSKFEMLDFEFELVTDDASFKLWDNLFYNKWEGKEQYQIYTTLKEYLPYRVFFEGQELEYRYSESSRRIDHLGSQVFFVKDAEDELKDYLEEEQIISKELLLKLYHISKEFEAYLHEKGITKETLEELLKQQEKLEGSSKSTESPSVGDSGSGLGGNNEEGSGESADGILIGDSGNNSEKNSGVDSGNNNVDDFEEPGNGDLNELGRKGEKYIYQILQGEYPENEGYVVKWLNKEGESFKAYDFEIIKDDTTIFYIDAKTTGGDKKYFYMSKKEYSFYLENQSIYQIYRVKNIADSIQDDTAYIKIESLKDWIEEGKIKEGWTLKMID